AALVLVMDDPSSIVGLNGLLVATELNRDLGVGWVDRSAHGDLAAHETSAFRRQDPDGALTLRICRRSFKLRQGCRGPGLVAAPQTDEHGRKDEGNNHPPRAYSFWTYENDRTQKPRNCRRLRVKQTSHFAATPS